MPEQCESVRQDLWRLIDREAAATASRDLAAHLGTCDSCRGELRRAIRIHRQVLENQTARLSFEAFMARPPREAVPSPPVPRSSSDKSPKSTARRRQLWSWMSAAAVVLFAAGVFAFNMWRSPRAHSPHGPVEHARALPRRPPPRLTGSAPAVGSRSGDSAGLPASAPTLAFEKSETRTQEGNKSVRVAVRLDGPVLEAISVQVRAVGGTAYASGCLRDGAEPLFGTGRDLVFDGGTMTFEPGESRKEVVLEILDDRINEADETLDLEISAPANVRVEAGLRHHLVIEDDDRKIVLDAVRDAGAIGNGTVNDRSALQNAIDRAAAAGGGVVLLPPEVYLVSGTLELRENVTLHGYGAVVRHAPGQGAWTSLVKANYSGTVDSRPFVIKGLTLDGRRDQQPAGRGRYLVAFSGSPGTPGRLRGFIEDTRFINGASSVLVTSRNVQMVGYRIDSANSADSSLLLAGGHSEVEVCEFSVRRGTSRWARAFDIRSVKPGFEGNGKLRVRLDRVTFHELGFSVAAPKGSQVTFDRLEADPPLFFFTPGSTVRISNSRLAIDATDSHHNRFVCPGDIEIAHSELRAVALKNPASPRARALRIDWSHPECPGARNQRMVLREVTTTIAASLSGVASIELVSASKQDPGSDNVLSILGGRISRGFTAGITMAGGGLLVEKVALQAPLEAKVGAVSTTLAGPTASLKLPR